MYADVSESEYDSLSLIITKYQLDIEPDSAVRRRLISNRIALTLESYSQSIIP